MPCLGHYLGPVWVILCYVITVLYSDVPMGTYCSVSRYPFPLEDASVAPQSYGDFFFFTTVRSLSRHRNLCRDRIPLSCAPNLGPPTYHGRPAWSVALAWPSLSRCNATTYCRDRESLSSEHILVVTQCLAPLSRHRKLCRDMEDLMAWNSLSQRKVYPVAT